MAKNEFVKETRKRIEEDNPGWAGWNELREVLEEDLEGFVEEKFEESKGSGCYNAVVNQLVSEIEMWL